MHTKCVTYRGCRGNKRPLICVCMCVQALGVLLYLMCFSKFPFQADAKAMVLKGNFVIPPSRHRPETCQLITRMLIVDPSRRPNIHEVISCTQNLLTSPGSAPVSPPPSHTPPAAYPQPIGTPPPNAMPHAAMAGYPGAAVVNSQPHSPMPAPPAHPYAVPPGSGCMNTHSHMPGNLMHGSPVPAAPIAQPPVAGGVPARGPGTPGPVDASGHARMDPFPAVPLAVASAPATGVRAMSGGAAVRDPFAASDQVGTGTGSRSSSAHADGALATGQTTASAPVSPTKRVPQPPQQAFGAGAHTADGVRKATGDVPVGSAAAAAEAKKRVFAAQHHKQQPQPQDQRLQGAADTPHARAAPGSPGVSPAPVASYPLAGVADGAEDAGGSGRHPAVAGMKQSTRLTARKAKAAAYAAMSGADGDGADGEGDVDGLMSAMSQLRIENERLRAELTARMAGAAANGSQPVDAEMVQEKEELVRKLRTTEEELEQRRLQVGEMKSIIDAMSTAPELPSQPPVQDSSAGELAPGTSSSRTLSPKKNGNSPSKHRSGFQEVSQRVWAILNETAGWQRSGLRRSVSEVHVAWSEFDEDSPLHP